MADSREEEKREGDQEPQGAVGGEGKSLLKPWQVQTPAKRPVELGQTDHRSLSVNVNLQSNFRFQKRSHFLKNEDTAC